MTMWIDRVADLRACENSPIRVRRRLPYSPDRECRSITRLGMLERRCEASAVCARSISMGATRAASGRLGESGLYRMAPSRSTPDTAPRGRGRVATRLPVQPARSVLAPFACVALAAIQEAPSQLARDLASALDAPDSKSRRSAALAIAASPGVTIDELLRAFPKALAIPPEAQDPDAKPGARTCKPLLRLEGGTEEETELHLYVPSSLDASHPAPLLLAFHGTSGSGADVEPMWRATAEKL